MLDTVERMNVFAILIAASGMLLFLASLTMALRANATSRIPFWRSPAVNPPGSIAMRAIGAGLLVLGAILLSTTAGWWALVILAVIPAVTVLALVAHNRRIAHPEA